MRLAPSVDLGPVRDAALERVDRVFAGRMAPSPFAEAHAEKARRARRMLESDRWWCPSIRAEAEARGIVVRDLARQIVRAAEDADTALMAIEAERHAVKARVRAAPDQHAILAILAEIESAAP